MVIEMHHIMKEEDQIRICPYCKAETKNGWKSEFHLEFHYKISKCKCGKKLKLKVNYIGDGNDDFDKKVEENFKKIRK